MKRLLLLLLILLSVNAFAQRKKSRTKKRTRHTVRHRIREANQEEAVPEEEKATYPFFAVDSITKKMVLTDPPNAEDRPLVLINDAEYNCSLKDIKRENIVDIWVIKRKGAMMMYGKKANAGALIVKTKQALPADLPSTLLPLPKIPIAQKSFVLNEELSYGKLSDIDTSTILKIDTLIQPRFAGSKDIDTTINVTTKWYGTKLYQWKFGTFSKAYKSYIRSLRGKDTKVVYILADGTELTGENKQQLFDQATKADIKTVTFTGPQGTRKNRKPATVSIEINQPAN